MARLCASGICQRVERMNRRRTLLWLGLGLLAAGALAFPAVAWAAPMSEEGGSAGGATFFGLIPLIVLFPVAGLLVNLAFGRYLGEKWVGIVACGAAGLSLLVAVLQLVSLQAHGFEAVT